MSSCSVYLRTARQWPWNRHRHQQLSQNIFTSSLGWSPGVGGFIAPVGGANSSGRIQQQQQVPTLPSTQHCSNACRQTSIHFGRQLTPQLFVWRWRWYRASLWNGQWQTSGHGVRAKIIRGGNERGILIADQRACDAKVTAYHNGYRELYIYIYIYIYIYK